MKNEKTKLLLLAACSLLFVSSARAADVLAHWTFDELVADGHAFPDANGTMRAIVADTSSATLDHGKDVPFGAAVALGPGGTGLNIPPIPGIYEHSFTVAAWVKLASASGPQYLLSDWEKPPAYFVGFDKGKATASLRSTKLSSKNAPLEFFSTKNFGAPVTPNAWHHVAWVWDRTTPKSGTMTIYVDGAKAAEAATNAKAPPLNILNNNRAFIGFKADTKSAFHGSVDELWVFHDALSAEQVANLMKSNDISSAQTLANAGPAAAAPTPAPTPAPAPAPATTTPPTTPTTPTANATPTNPTTPAAPTTPTTPTTPPAAATPPSNNAPPTFTTTATPTPAAPPPAPTAPPAANNSAGSNKSAPPTFTSPSFTVKSGPTPDTTTNTPAEVAAAKPPHYTPARIAGIIVSGIASLSLSAFLFWASAERGKMKHARR